MLTVDEARTLITTSLSDVAVADAIAREEAWLARRIGPIDGERVETFVSEDGDEVLQLQRPARVLDIEDDNGAVGDVVDLRGWADVVITEGRWNGTVQVTYTPDDEAEVKRALVTLLRLAVAESAYASEGAQGYSVGTDAAQQRATRWAAWHGLLRPRQPTTTRIRSSLDSADSVRAVSVAASA